MSVRPKTDKLEVIRYALGCFHILIKTWDSTKSNDCVFEESSINYRSSIDEWSVYYIHVDLLREDDGCVELKGQSQLPVTSV